MMNPERVKHIRENIGRAKGYLSRNEFSKSIDAIKEALEVKLQTKMMGKDRIELEFSFEEFCILLSSHTAVKQFLGRHGVNTNQNFVTYKPGGETDLIKKLVSLKLLMENEQMQEEQDREEKRGQRQSDLLERGQAYLDEKNFAKGRAYFKRLVEEYGDEPEVIRDVGERFLKAELHMEAIEMLKLAIEKFPNDDQAFRHMVEALRQMKEYEQAEKVYQVALKQFGGHPQTYLNLALMYVEWRKLDLAYDAAKAALERDPKLKKAKELLDKLDKKTSV